MCKSGLVLWNRCAIPTGLVLVSLGLALSASTALAAEQEAVSRISAVTVFSRAAEVSRVTDVNVPAGDHVIVLKGLPARLLADSIRIEGGADGTLEIGAIDTKPVLLPEAASATSERKRIEEDIVQLNDRLAVLTDRITAAQAQKVLIQNLAKLPVQPGPRNAAQGARGPAEWAGISSLILAQMSDAQKAVREANVAMRDVQRQIADKQRKLAGIAPRKIRRTEVRVNVKAASALKADLTVRYQVADAGWQPVYDARLVTGDDATKPALKLGRRARVWQRTGEPWRDVALTLSTTNPRQGTAAPDVYSLRAEFEPGLIKDSKKSSDLVREEMEASKPQASRVQPTAGARSRSRRRIVRKPAAVVAAPFQTNYVIAGKQTVGTDGTVRGIDIDTVTFAPKLAIRAVPRKRAAAFLYADFKVADGNRFLPGPVSLFRDGVFTGRGRLPVLASGENHELGFGEDDSIRIEHIKLGQKTGESGLISTTKTDTRTFKTTLFNGHARAITVRVFDQLPVAGDADIQVLRTVADPAPDLRDVENKKGVLVWDVTMKPGAKQEINFGYRLSWPGGRNIRLREVRNKKKYSSR